MKRLIAITLALLMLACTALGALAQSDAPDRTIDTFYVSRMIEGGFASYSITADGGEYRVSVDDGPEQPFGADAVGELMNAIEKYDIAAWDGFSASDNIVEDGEYFRLEIGFTDGTGIVARGENAFPDNYDVAMAEIWRILTWNAEDAADEHV